jgi:hypothetical protein
MEYIVGGMMLIFILVGVGLIWQAIKSLLLMASRKSFLIQTTGEIVRIERKRVQRSSGSIRRRAQVANYPVIEFRTQMGELRTFQSEIGDVSEDTDFLAGPDAPTGSKYRVGQPIAVFYDPGNQMPPVIESLRTVWYTSAMLAGGGAVFIGGGLLILFAFGDRIFAALPIPS